MQSLDLLPALRELPSDDQRRRSFREIIADLHTTDSALHAAEFTASVSFGMWGIWDSINVDDTLFQAHRAAFTNYDGSLFGHWQEMAERGPESAAGFVSTLKGKVAELNFAETLKRWGFTDVTSPDDPTQPVWDIPATAPDGETIFWQVKTGAAEYAGEVENAMFDNPGVLFANSSEVFERIAERSPELTNQMVDIGSNTELTGEVNEGLGLLTDNLGIDIPDGVGEIIPYAGAIIAASRLIYSVVQTERQFKAVDRTTRNKIQVVQTLTLMSRMGVTTVLSTVGGMGGGAAGSVIPGIGNAVGGIAGAVAGAGMGMYLNRHLQPHMLDLALDITGLTNDDLFYYKNKPQIDQVALSFRQTAKALNAAPAT